MNNKRISRETMLMNIARIVALRGTCNRPDPHNKVGVVIAKDNRIIVTGYVGSAPGSAHCIDAGCLIGPDGGCIRTIHAEEAAVRFAEARNISLSSTILYTTLSPCFECSKLIYKAGISKVIYYKKYRKTNGIEFLISAGIEVKQYQKSIFRFMRLI